MLSCFKNILSFFGSVSAHHSNISLAPRGPASLGTKGLKPKLHGTFRKQPIRKSKVKIDENKAKLNQSIYVGFLNSALDFLFMH